MIEEDAIGMHADAALYNSFFLSKASVSQYRIYIPASLMDQSIL